MELWCKTSALYLINDRNSDYKSKLFFLFYFFIFYSYPVLLGFSFSAVGHYSSVSPHSAALLLQGQTEVALWYVEMQWTSAHRRSYSLYFID